MDCEHVREEFVDRLTGSIDPDRSKAIDAHIAGCAGCRAETDRMRELWTELGALSVAGASGSASRVERLIDARSRQADGSVVPTRARPVPRVALFAIALAASVLVGVMIGRGSGAAPAALTTQAGPVATINPAKEKYVLLLHGPARARGTAVQAAADSANERALVAEYAAWAGRLAGEGSLIAGEKLADDPLTMLVANGTVDVRIIPVEP